MVTKEDLAELREKYVRIRGLRRAHDRARSDPRFVEPDPTEELRAIAATWPGALRELDTLPLALVDARIDALGGAIEEAGVPEPWMIAQVRFHRLARGALVAKRWTNAGRRTTAPEAAHPLGPHERASFAAAMASEPHGRDALAWEGALDTIARPPGRRLTRVVLARLAEELGISEGAARLLVFPKRERREAPNGT